MRNASHRLEAHIAKALNKIRKPSTVEEITDLLNAELEAGDQSFKVEKGRVLREREWNRLDSILVEKSPSQIGSTGH